MDRFIGIDVAQATLDIAARPEGDTWSVTNDEPGLAELVPRLGLLAPTLVVLEATGGFETAAVAALATGGLPVGVVNPRQVRDVATALGRLAKTDRLDAAILAEFAQRLRPAPRPLPAAAAQVLDALLARRRQRIERLTPEQHRLGFARDPVKRDITQPLRWLEKRLADVDGDLAAAIAARSPPSSAGRRSIGTAARRAARASSRSRPRPGCGPGSRSSTPGSDTRPAGNPTSLDFQDSC